MLQWHSLENFELSIAGQRFEDQNRVMMAQMKADVYIASILDEELFSVHFTW